MVSGKPIYEELEERVQKLTREIEVHKTAERKLAKTQQLLLAAIEQSPAGIMIYDVQDQQFLIANSAALGISEKRPPDATAIPELLHPFNWKIYYPDGRALADEELPLRQAVKDGSTVRSMDVIIRRADGQERWVLGDAAPVRDSQGRIIAGIVVFPDVTELRDQQARYKRLFQDASMGILLADEQMHILDANRQALKMLGYTYEEITQMAVSDLLHPDDLNAQPLITPAAINDPERVVTIERHYLCKGGNHIPVEVNLRVFPNNKLLAMFQDISQRKQAEEALRAANEALEVVYRCSNAAIVCLDRKACVTFWNPAAEEMFGWTEQEVIGKPYPAVPPEQRKAFESLFEQQMSGKPISDEPILRQRRDGSNFYVSTTTGPMRNEKGEIVGSISVMIDITKRKQTEQALQQSEERYRSLVENTQDGYFICQVPSGRFHFLNQRLCDLLAYSHQEGLSLSLWDIIAPDDHEALGAMMDASGDGDRIGPGPQVFRALTKEGNVIRAEISAARVTFEEKPALQGLLRDITEKERLQAQLQQAQRLESIGTLAGGVAHDFNNLLMAIQGNASLALLNLKPTHPAYERLKSISSFIQDASALTKQLLGFARGGKYEVKVTDLNLLVAKTAQLFGRTKKEITLHTQLQPNIWMVEVDRVQIEQVLLNIFVNAWQAMPGGGQIFLETENAILDSTYSTTFSVAPGRYVKVSITDTGIGMDKSIQAKIFEPFFTTKDRSRGTGLGLASAYGIIKNHDGIIQVYSERGRGATFSIYLPSVQKSVEQGEAEVETLVRGKETILLVDDEEMILNVGKEMLDELDYRVLLASSGTEALGLYAQNWNSIDLVILDMIMPDMGGGETYDKLRRINPELKTLLCSGYSLNDEATQILSRGCNGFIQKPFSMEVLSRKIRDVLD